MTVGDAKEDFNQKGKKKFSNYKKRKNKGEGVNGKPDVAPVAAEIDARLLSALLTVSWCILFCVSRCAPE